MFHAEYRPSRWTHREEWRLRANRTSKKALLVSLLLLAAILAACKREVPPEKALLGLCLPAGIEAGWGGALLAEAEKAAKELGIAETAVAVSSPLEGVIGESIDELIEKKVHAVILYAEDEAQCIEAAEKLQAAKIPLVLIGGAIDQTLYTALVTGDFAGMGKAAGEAVTERLGQRGSVLMLCGPAGQMTDALNRSFTEALYPYADIEIIAKDPAGGKADIAASMTEAWLETNEIQAIFAHNDEMAIGAVKVLKEQMREDVLIVTGVGGSREALDMVMKNNRYLKLTFDYGPDLAEEAVRVAAKVMAGEEFEKVTVMPIHTITAQNAMEYYDENSAY